jgi:RNA polymerase sigma-70 factor (ECF subfamily)
MYLQHNLYCRADETRSAEADHAPPTSCRHPGPGIGEKQERNLFIRSAELFELARGGDRDAFGQLVRLHEEEVLAVARRYLPEDDARDVAQRAFVRAYETLGALRGRMGFRAWLKRTARNLALNVIRERRRMDRLEDVGDLRARPSMNGVLVLDDLRDRLRNAVRRLPPKQRLVVEQRVFRERSFRDIARLAGCTEEAAKSNFHHAAKQLRQWLG